MIIKIRIDGDNLTVNDPGAIVSGSKNYYELRAAFTSDWSGLTKYVIFPSAECSLALTAEDTATLPEALIAERGILTFGLIGIDGDGDLRIATNYVRLRILEGAREIHALPPSPDDDATWEGYLGAIAKRYVDQLTGVVEGRFPLKTADLSDGAVTAQKLGERSVSETKLQAGSVTQGKIKDGAVTAGKLADGAVTSAKIGDRQVGLAKLTPGTSANKVLVTVYENNQYETHWREIDASMIMDGQVKTAELADKAVSAEKLQAGSVTQGKIQDGAVTEGKLDPAVKSKLHTHSNKTVLDKVTDAKISAWDKVVLRKFPAPPFNLDDYKESGAYWAYTLNEIFSTAITGGPKCFDHIGDIKYIKLDVTKLDEGCIIQELTALRPGLDVHNPAKFVRARVSDGNSFKWSVWQELTAKFWE